MICSAWSGGTSTQRLDGPAQRRALLTAALAALRVAAREPELELLHQWLDTWTGVGLITAGTERQDYRLHLMNVEPGRWRATFSGHSLFAADGHGGGPTPWRAVQVATWEVVGRGLDQPANVR